MNCLPFSLLAHRFVGRTDRNAKVVIGRLLPIGVTLSSRSKNSIQTFHANNWLNTKPKFHAWICLGNGTIYDAVGPKLQNMKTGNVISDWDYLNTEKALESGFKYHEVIRERSKVTDFYRRLRLGQIFQWQAINLQTTSAELIEKKLLKSWMHTSPLK
ncbi:hypothetical protein ALT721_210010 [Alteromonas alvinellae]